MLTPTCQRLSQPWTPGTKTPRMPAQHASIHDPPSLDDDNGHHKCNQTMHGPPKNATHQVGPSIATEHSPTVRQRRGASLTGCVRWARPLPLGGCLVMEWVVLLPRAAYQFHERV